MTEISPRNELRWRQFEDAESFERVQRLVLDVVAAGGLELKELGVTWGVTVNVDSSTLLRLNVADYCLLDISDPNETLENRYTRLAVIPQWPRLWIAARWAKRGRDRRWELRPGFTRYLSDSQILATTFFEIEALVRRPSFRDGIECHINARPRKLFSADRHNPLTSALFS